MDVSDLLLLALILMALWTFVPRHVRRALRSGAEPAVIALADLARVGIYHALRGLRFVGYRWLLGVSVPGESERVLSSRDDATADEPVRIVAEPPDTNAVRTSTSGGQEKAGDAPIISHNMSGVELIAVLSVQKDERGGYRFSANKIADFIGGTRADVLSEIKSIREPGQDARYTVLNEERRPILN